MQPNMRSVIVLPAPLGSNNPKTSPSLISRDRLSTAVILLYFLV